MAEIHKSAINDLDTHTQVCIFFFAECSPSPEAQIYFRIGGISVAILDGFKSIFLVMKSNKTIVVPENKNNIFLYIPLSADFLIKYVSKTARIAAKPQNC